MPPSADGTTARAKTTARKTRLMARSLRVSGVNPVRTAPAQVVRVVVDHVGPDGPRDPARAPVEERGPVERQQRASRNPAVKPGPEAVDRVDVPVEELARQNAPAVEAVHHPDRVPDRSEEHTSEL